MSDNNTDYESAIIITDEIQRNNALKACAENKFSIQLTFGITYQTTPDLFD